MSHDSVQIRDVPADERSQPSGPTRWGAQPHIFLRRDDLWFDTFRGLTAHSVGWGRMWAVAGPQQSGKTYLAACLSYLLSTGRERAVPVDATFSSEPVRQEGGGGLTSVLGAQATRSLSEATFEALSAMRHALMLRFQTLAETSKPARDDVEKRTHVILDLGSGTLHSNLGFLPLADDPVLVTGTDQESFIRTLMVIYRAALEFWRLLFRKHTKALAIVNAELSRQGDLLYGDLKSFWRQLASADHEASRLAALTLERFRPGVIFNPATPEEAASAIEDLWQLSTQEIGVELDYLGSLPHDDGVPGFVNGVRPHFVADPNAQEASWAARETVRKLRVADDGDDQDTHMGVLVGSQSALPGGVLICNDRCDQWRFCGYRDPGYACTIQYLQPAEFGVIKPIHLERYAETRRESAAGGARRIPNRRITGRGDSTRSSRRILKLLRRRSQ